jgi:hypothetical protein
MTTYPEPYIYTDLDGDELHISTVGRFGGAAVSLRTTYTSSTGAGAAVHIPTADVDQVIAAIRSASGKSPNRPDPDTTPANELRQAADDLQALATAANGTTWGVARTQDTHPEGDGATHVIGVESATGDPDSKLIFQDEEVSEEDTEYIAAMGPALGLALATWLNAEAEQRQALDVGQHIPGGEHALAVARAINARPR